MGEVVVVPAAGRVMVLDLTREWYAGNGGWRVSAR